MKRRLLLLLVVLLTVKALLLLADHEPSFFFGDSRAYLATAVAGVIPYDRSFLYGFLLRPLVARSHSLIPVVLGQAALSSIASWIVGLVLVRYFRSSFPVAVACALACALEPLQLMSERFIMTETISTFAFAVYFWACCSFMETGSLWVLAASQVVGVFLVGIRFSFLPMVLVLSFVVPLLSPNFFHLCSSRSAPNIFRAAAPLLVAVLLSQTLLFGYRHWYGYLAHEPAAYLSRDGDFWLADVAPIVKPVDFPAPAKRKQVFESLQVPLENPDARRVHRWMDGGLCKAILRTTGNDEDEANRLALKTAVRAIKRDPVGLLKLAAFTYAEFFAGERMKWALELNQGQHVDPTASDVAFMQSEFRIDVSHRRFKSVTKRWEAMAEPWCWLLVILPFAYTALLVLRWQRTQKFEVLCALCSWLFLLSAVIPTEFANPRYLTALAWLAFVMIGSIGLTVRAALRINGTEHV